VITASPQDFVTVQRVIGKLDIPRDEVYVEVAIMEVSLGKDFEFSAGGNVGTVASTPNSDLLSFLQNPVANKGIILGMRSSESLGTFQGVPIPNVSALIRALQTTNKANVLATPQIMTLDNVEATFETNEKIPIQKESVSNGVISKSIDKEKITLSLKIKPQINKVSNYVKLDVKAEMEDITQQVPKSLEGQAFGSFSRKTETSIIIADGDTVVLGGLIRDKRDETVAKVPILGDIPLLGWLFRSRTESMKKTNLVIMLTPHIVRHYEKVRAILDKKLQQRDEFLQKNAGGEDPHRDARDDMIRSLPEMKDILKRKEKNTFNLGDEPQEQSSLGTPPGGESGYSAPTESPMPAPDHGGTPPGITPPPMDAAPPPPPPVGDELPDSTLE
jgi:general secretion pathway protein D